MTGGWFMRRPLLAVTLILATMTASAQTAIASVRIAHAELRELAPVISVAGQVQTRSSADLAASVEGTLAMVDEVGTPVKKGQVVARLDTAPLELQRAEQSARVTHATIALQQAQREYERLQGAGDAVTRDQVDQQQSNRDLAQSDLDIARATLHQTEEKLSRMEFRAPFDGVVTDRVKRAGEYASIGDVVARLGSNGGGLEVHLFLPLRHVRAIRPGTLVTVDVEGSQTQAPVRAIVPVGDMRSQSFEVVLDAEAMSPQPAVGSLVQAKLPLSLPHKSLAVPRDAIIIRAEGMAVFAVQDGKAKRVPVTTGVADGEWVEVKGALSDGDSVVVRGGESLHDADPVQVLASSS
jgi:RND family efflux transporter MFP subunit